MRASVPINPLIPPKVVYFSRWGPLLFDPNSEANNDILKIQNT